MKKEDISDSEVGKRLKTLRKEHHLTLNELSRRAGCTTAALSKIERGEVAPTISLLKRVVNVLGVTLSEFLAHDNGYPDSIVLHKEERVKIDFPTEKIISYQLVRHLKDKMIQPLYEIIKPGGGSGGSYSHQGEEFGLILEGELEITVDGVAYTVKEGDSFCYKSSRQHSFRNKSAEDVRLIWIITPPTY